MDLIRPRLAIGTRVEAESAHMLAAHGIDAVLSMTAAEVPSSVTWLQLAVRDGQPVAPGVLERAVEFLDAQLRAERRVLVHCEMGLSRSPAVVACYLAQAERMPLRAAVAEIRRARELVQPHPALLESVAGFLARGHAATARLGAA